MLLLMIKISIVAVSKMTCLSLLLDLFPELQALPLVNWVEVKKHHPYQQKCDGNWREQYDQSSRHSVTMVTSTCFIAHKPADEEST